MTISALLTFCNSYELNKLKTGSWTSLYSQEGKKITYCFSFFFIWKFVNINSLPCWSIFRYSIGHSCLLFFITEEYPIQVFSKSTPRNASFQQQDMKGLEHGGPSRTQGRLGLACMKQWQSQCWRQFKKTSIRIAWTKGEKEKLELNISCKRAAYDPPPQFFPVFTPSPFLVCA